MAVGKRAVMIFPTDVNKFSTADRVVVLRGFVLG
jgi:hypothetical protein